MVKFFNEAENALKAKPGVNLYGNNPVTDAEIAYAFAECLESTLPMDYQIHILIAEAEAYANANDGNVVAAMIYCEAEGGFFKKVINALITVYNKAKDFIVKILGKFKSDKAYRQDLVFIKDIVASLSSVTFNDNATIQMKKSKYGSLTAMVVNILSTDNATIANGKLGTGDGGATLKELNAEMKGVIKAFSGQAGASSASVSKLTTSLQGITGKYATADAWTKELLGQAIAGSVSGKKEGVAFGTGDAQFTATSSQTANEAVSKLWDESKVTLKGAAIADARVTLQFFVDSVKYDNMSKAIEEGVSVFTEQINDLKSNLTEVENSSKAAQNNPDSNEALRDLAAKGATVSTMYTKTLSMYSTVVTTAFNLAKTSLDKLIRDMRSLAEGLDGLRKSSSSNKPAPAPAE